MTLKIAILKSYSGHNYTLLYSHVRSGLLEMRRVAQISFSHSGADLSGVKCLPFRNHSSSYHPYFVGAAHMAFIHKTAIGVSASFALAAIGLTWHLISQKKETTHTRGIARCLPRDMHISLFLVVRIFEYRSKTAPERLILNNNTLHPAHV